MARHKRLSYKLGVFAPWRRLFDMDPVLLAVTLIIISPMVMWLNDILLVHGRLLSPNEQWLSAQFDIALALAAAVGVGLLRNIDMQKFPNFLRSRLLHWTCLLLAVATSLLHVWQERGSITTWERRLGPNSLYHNLVLYPLLGYLLLVIVISVVVVWVWGWQAGVQYAVGMALMVVLIGSWVVAGRYDATHQYAPGGTPKAVIANPPDPWCGGLLTEPICGPAQR